MTLSLIWVLKYRKILKNSKMYYISEDCFWRYWQSTLCWSLILKQFICGSKVERYLLSAAVKKTCRYIVKNVRQNLFKAKDEANVYSLLLKASLLWAWTYGRTNKPHLPILAVQNNAGPRRVKYGSIIKIYKT